MLRLFAVEKLPYQAASNRHPCFIALLWSLFVDFLIPPFQLLEERFSLPEYLGPIIRIVLSVVGAENGLHRAPLQFEPLWAVFQLVFRSDADSRADVPIERQIAENTGDALPGMKGKVRTVGQQNIRNGLCSFSGLDPCPCTADGTEAENTAGCGPCIALKRLNSIVPAHPAR